VCTAMRKRAQQGDVRERRSSFELLDRESLGSLGKRRLCFSGVVTRSSNPWIGVVSARFGSIWEAFGFNKRSHVCGGLARLVGSCFLSDVLYCY